MTEDATVVERRESDVSPEGRLLLDLVRFPHLKNPPDEDHYQVMEGILEICPQVLGAIAETVKRSDLPEEEQRSLRVVDEIYGISRGVGRKQTDVAGGKRSPQRIGQLRDKGLRHLLTRIQLDTERGPVSLSQLKTELVLRRGPLSVK